MRAPKTLFVAVSMASLLAACSKPQPKPDAALARDLDLALSTGSRSVVSAVELGAKPKPEFHAPAAPVRVSVAKHIPLATKPSKKETAPAPEPAKVTPQPEETVAAAAPAPEPTVVAQLPPAEAQPSADPQPARTGGGRGNYPGGGEGGFRIPGIGGVIIIRGGGNGMDPCDERDGHHGRHGGMGGGILMNPRAPSLPGMGGSWGGGGGRFLGR